VLQSDESLGFKPNISSKDTRVVSLDMLQRSKETLDSKETKESKEHKEFVDSNGSDQINLKLVQFRERLMQLEQKYSEKEQSNVELKEQILQQQSELDQLHGK